MSAYDWIRKMLTRPFKNEPDQIVISQTTAREITEQYGKVTFENWLRYHGLESRRIQPHEETR